MTKEVIGGDRMYQGEKMAYSRAIRAGDFVFVAGHIPFNPDGTFNDGPIEEQTRMTLNDIKAVLEEAGSGLGDVVKATVFLTERNDFLGFNRTYAEFFPEGPPARTAVHSELLADVRVEIEVIAYSPR